MIHTGLMIEIFGCLLLACVLLRDLLREDPINSRILHIFITEHEKRIIKTISETEQTLIRNTQNQLREVQQDLKEVIEEIYKNKKDGK